MLLIVSVVCLTNQSSSTKSERNMVIKRSKNPILQAILISKKIAGGPLLCLLTHPLVVSHRLLIRKACVAPTCHLKCSHTRALICSRAFDCICKSCLYLSRIHSVDKPYLVPAAIIIVISWCCHHYTVLAIVTYSDPSEFLQIFLKMIPPRPVR